ncbi:MAG TPA: glycoside hydrolase family 38 C-terminal domain-containing protein [Candidatus Elarobacter sp.]|nr:glycoside hydrolase family 38 C-terminal domain-containing protein [Candidatus Elarobacter sp.]
MRIRLARRGADEGIVTLIGRAVFPDGPLRLRYATRTGALLRVDGAVRGAFDGKHATIDLPPAPGDHEIALDVERRALPISGLPAGDGVRWRLMLALAAQRPGTTVELDVRPEHVDGAAIPVPLVGHAHLDVAWLWTYDATHRKAMRTFATALREIDLDERFVYAQSQPQLYAWVFAADDDVAARVRVHAASRWDASVASMWVEPDLHAPSGESVLRQFAHGIRWSRDNLGVEPSIAWLPDTFGFPSTFPQLAAHAGVGSFATTKLQWNETTRWPYPRFRWIGDDGSALVAAVLDGYDGPLSDDRVERARSREEMLIVGYGDGGGGATDDDLARAGAASPGWTRVDDWFASFANDALPEHRGELYLETHRGTYTTHHDVKARNAELERMLARSEELAAWCVAVRAPATVRRALADDLRSAWRIVLRAQFHDVITGTSIAGVYVDVHAEYDRARAIATRVAESAASVLPRSDLHLQAPAMVEPRRDGEAWVLENAYVRARVRDDGTIDELSARDGPNVVSLANGITAYADRPKRWDAWNVDAGYERAPVRVKPDGAAVEDGDLVVRLAVGRRSRCAMRVALHEDEPWVRVEAAVAWQENHVLLRAEHRLALRAREVRFGQQHGTLVRTAFPETDAERARFEVPGQRWAHASDGDAGLAVLTPDLYGWNAIGLKGGGIRLGTSLLRSPRWPDPGADRGEQRLAYALVPTAGATISALEHAWEAYVAPDRGVRLFTCDDEGVLIVATAPSDDAESVVVRVRECDGEQRRVALRCGGRMREAIPVDAVERPIAGDAAIEEESLVFGLGPFALRSFLVRFW